MLRFIYPALLVACVIFVLWKGRVHERVIMGALLVGSVNTYVIYISRTGNWLDPNLAMLANEIVITLIILAIAHRSNQFWPLPISAFQLLALMSQVVSFFGQDLEAYAIGVTQGLWAYLQLIILIFVVLRNVRRKTNPTRSEKLNI